MNQPNRDYLLKMADAEDAAGSTSVCGMAADMGMPTAADVWRCLICLKPVPEYVPEYCCHRQDCGCHGEPSEPCVCSEQCYDAVMNNIGETYDARRRLAGIHEWSDEKPSPPTAT